MPCLVLEIGIIDAYITEKRVFADFEPVVVFCKMLEGVMESHL